ncbi:MAG: prolyl oligopeptidase family serine peptidase [Bacteroidetes bacterium]|nr:prolyl oligopeptidase family serine peptidase [Bacteroidota bacterium]
MRRPLLALALVVALAAPSYAQAPAGGYRTPAPELVRLVDAPATPGVVVSPDGQTLLFVEQSDLPTIEEISRPELRLAGMRLDPRTNGPSRTRAATALRLGRLDGDGSSRAVTGLPVNPRVRNVQFSPDGRHVAFTHDAANRIELWTMPVASAQARRVGTFAINETLAGAFDWLPSSDGFVATLVTSRRPALPPETTTPSGPVTQETAGRAAPSRTYQDLLASPSDEQTFEHYATAQAARVTLAGAVTNLGAPGLVSRTTPSPDGRFVLVETMKRPFSYLVPAGRFPRTLDVLDARTGRLVKRVADLPLMENVPVSFGSTTEGVRSAQWRADAPATLVWVEALDGGDGRRQATERDRVFALAAPFTSAPTVLATLPFRYGGIQWGDGSFALVSEFWQATRQLRTYRFAPDQPGALVKVLDRSSEDRYTDPGRPATVATAQGTRVLLRDAQGALFTIGGGASPEGDRPFVRRWDVNSGETVELFRSSGEAYEAPVAVLDAQGKILTQRETPTEPPNFWLRETVRRVAPRQVTRFAHPYPEFANIQKELITYRRADGVPLSATLYLPAGYDAQRDGPLPTFVWAYPAEFKTADAAGQVTGSPYRFNRISFQGAVPFVLRGYAVLDNAAVPIVGEGDVQPNDTFVEQLVGSMRAAIDEGVRRGVVDSTRVGVGGHSYGAFMTANLLAHSNLFRAGIARSGAYNRTLTPFGFQNEERTYWQAPDVYNRMSPFMNAEKIDEPLLMIHGMADNNPGTFPIQSERLYNAVKGLGGTARLVMLPSESHGYAARESLLHMLWEMDTWLERFVKTPARPSGSTR